MKNIFCIFLVFFPIYTYSQFNIKKTYTIVKTTKSPKIDGLINDNIWDGIEIANNFYQIEPNNGKKEKYNERSEVKICYDNKNIYFGIKLFDNSPDSILNELSIRDQENKNFDWFNIKLNPFNDGQVEYNFIVTAAGVQIDKKISNGQSDINWDAVWRSEVKIDSDGWTAEVSIPFSSLRFIDNNEDWSLNMIRNIRRHRESYSWNPIDVKYGNYELQSGILRGITNVNSPIRLSFMPYSSIYTDIFEKDISYIYNYGLDLKYGINESFTLDMTLIPDFGQVVSDAEILNLSPFEIRYDENRQFFNEGIELFNKGENMFYSRRIQDNLINATKISGRTKKGLGFATLNAITNKTEEKPLTNYNVTIFDQIIKNNSYISIMNTNMLQMGSNKNANVTGIFTSINNKNNMYNISSNIKISQEFENNNIIKGYSGNFFTGKKNGKFRYNLWTYFEDEKFNPNDLGYLQSNNEIKSGISLSYNQLKENKKFVRSKAEYEMSYNTLFNDGNGKSPFVNLDVNLDGSITFKNYLSIWGKINIFPIEGNNFYEARTNDFLNPIKTSKLFKLRTHLSTDYRKKLALDFSIGGSIKPLYTGAIYHLRISPRYRINNRLSIKYIISIENKYNDIGYVTTDTMPILIHPPEIRYIFGLRDVYMKTNVLEGTYILSNKMNISTKLRHYWSGYKYKENNFLELENTGHTTNTEYYGNHDANFNAWTLDMIFNWWFSPGSQISIVWKNSSYKTDEDFIPNIINNFERTFMESQLNSISFKIIYYLDYLYIKNDRK